jgi:RNA polymerase sigma-70 factor, ECF subfamily
LRKEQELLQGVRSGEQEAFALLVKDLLPTAYKNAFLILKSKEYAEDALQNALEGAYVTIMKNKEMSNFKAWFLSLVYSRSIDIYRKINRHLHNDFDSDREAQLNLIDLSAQQQAIKKETKQEMLSKILELKREQSLPLFLHYYEDLSVADIALILGENPNTVKTRMKRGKQQLAEILKQSTTLLQEVKTHGV